MNVKTSMLTKLLNAARKNPDGSQDVCVRATSAYAAGVGATVRNMEAIL